MKKLLFTLVTLILATPNYAQDFSVTSEEGVEIWFSILDDETCCTAEDGCIDLDTEGKVTIPDEANGYAVVGISASSFEDCEGVTEVVLPHYLQWIDERAFYNCGIEQVTLGDIDGSYTELGLELYDQAFNRCTNLTKVTLGKNVSYFGSGVFNNCGAIEEVYSYIEEPFAIGSTSFVFTNPDLTLYVPAGTKEAYENTAGWSSFPNIVEMGGTTAVKDIKTASAITGMKYINVSGLVCNQPFPGINIVVTSYSNGTTTTQKIMK